MNLISENVSISENNIHNYSSDEFGDFVKISVTDNGTGMSPEIKAKLFETIPALKALRDSVLVKTRNQKYLCRKIYPKTTMSSTRHSLRWK